MLKCLQLHDRNTLERTTVFPESQFCEKGFENWTPICIFLEPNKWVHLLFQKSALQILEDSCLVPLSLSVPSPVLQMTLLWIPFPHPHHLPLGKHSSLSVTSFKRKYGAQSRAHTFQAAPPAENAVGGVRIFTLLVLDTRLLLIRPNFKWAFSVALKCLLRFSSKPLRSPLSQKP